MLKLFEKFNECFLEICITDKDRARFESLYLAATGQTPNKEDGYWERDLHNKADAWGIEYRIYFKTKTSWLIESLAKIGVRVEQPKHMIAIELGKHHPEHGYKLRIANSDFFWDMVRYGYRLGKNKTIPYQQYEMNCALQEMETKRFTIIPMIQVEAENPVDEAKMFAAIA